LCVESAIASRIVKNASLRGIFGGKEQPNLYLVMKIIALIGLESNVDVQS
jgi:hypothetical protein